MKKLKNFLNLFKCYKLYPYKNIPSEISFNERIVRSIFSPINLSKNQKTIKPNAFKPPSDLDVVSVNRLDYTNVNFCKAISKKMEMPESDRNYFGLALLFAKEIKECCAKIIYSPQKDNRCHADINIGFVVKRGEPLPSEIQQKINNLTKNARLFKDENPQAKKWTGSEIK